MTGAPRRIRPRLATAFGAALVVSAHASSFTQTQPVPANDRIVVGSLVDAVSGRPVAGALITVSSGAAAVPARGGPPAATQATSAVSQRVFTDDGGRFMFHSLPAASLALAATLTGYAPAQFGQTRFGGSPARLELQSGPRVTNVTMKMWKLGSITGTIRDEAGEPIGGARLQVLAVAGPPSRREYMVRSFPITDDRGVYRAGELPPGDYLVQVPLFVNAIPTETAVAYLDAMAARSGNRVREDILASGGTLTTGGFQIGDQLIQPASGRGVPSPLSVDAAGHIRVYPQTYHQGAHTVAAARVVTLPPGEQRSGIDVALTPVPAFRVSGMVTGPDGPAPHTTVKITPEGVDGELGTPSTGSEIAMAVTRRDGTFTAIGIPAGRYVASVTKAATAPSIDGPGPTDLRLWWARAPVGVGDADVSRVELQLTPGATISGRIEFDAATPPSAAVLQRARVTLRANPSAGERQLSAPLNANGTFTSAEVRPGRYLLSVQPPPPGLVLKALQVGGRDVTGESIDVAASGVRDVVVTFTDKAGELTGTVTRSAPVETAVYAVPVDSRTPTQVRPALLRRVLAEADGTYRFTALVPGEYMVAAVLAGAPEIDPGDPRAIAAFVRAATRVMLGD